jgi:hypothetical protein
MSQITADVDQYKVVEGWRQYHGVAKDLKTNNP